jgi:hypothetical protein
MFEAMDAIGKVLESKVERIDRNVKDVNLRVRTKGLKGNTILIEYLTKFSLKSSKRLDMES